MHVPTHPLPALYARWLGDLLEAPLPGETRATCADCPMCEVPGQPPPATAYPFRADVKCCTTIPVLPSFLVGGILREDGPGARTVRDRIAARAAVTPLGLGPPASARILGEQGVNLLGRSRTLRCPHLVDGACAIHAHRNHRCATWFCKHERGAVGQTRWAAVGDLLRTLEGELARWAALELGVPAALLSQLIERDGPQPVERTDADAIDGHVSDTAWATRWGPWAGREEAYYVAAAERVEGLSTEEVLQIGGATARVFVEALRAALTDPPLPDRLGLGRLQTLAMGPQSSVVASYSPLDPLTLPALLLSVLPYFDGRPTHEAFEAIAEERGIKLDDALVRQLLDFGVLAGWREP